MKNSQDENIYPLYAPHSCDKICNCYRPKKGKFSRNCPIHGKQKMYMLWMSRKHRRPGYKHKTACGLHTRDRPEEVTRRKLTSGLVRALRYHFPGNYNEWAWHHEVDPTIALVTNEMGEYVLHLYMEDEVSGNLEIIEQVWQKLVYKNLGMNLTKQDIYAESAWLPDGYRTYMLGVNAHQNRTTHRPWRAMSGSVFGGNYTKFPAK